MTAPITDLHDEHRCVDGQQYAKNAAFFPVLGLEFALTAAICH